MRSLAGNMPNLRVLATLYHVRVEGEDLVLPRLQGKVFESTGVS